MHTMTVPLNDSREDDGRPLEIVTRMRQAWVKVGAPRYGEGKLSAKLRHSRDRTSGTDTRAADVSYRASGTDTRIVGVSYRAYDTKAVVESYCASGTDTRAADVSYCACDTRAVVMS